jgi:hypothetical protein
MPLDDYAHWNEEAPRIWWEEEGKHEAEYDPGDYDYDDCDNEED